MILGLCCVKNCEAWIEQVLATHLRVCDRILVLDDGSADKTGRIARSFDRVHYRRQDGLPRNEARDRNSLFAEVHDLLPAAGGEPEPGVGGALARLVVGPEEQVPAAFDGNALGHLPPGRAGDIVGQVHTTHHYCPANARFAAEKSLRL